MFDQTKIKFIFVFHNVKLTCPFSEKVCSLAWLTNHKHIPYVGTHTIYLKRISGSWRLCSFF